MSNQAILTFIGANYRLPFALLALVLLADCAGSPVYFMAPINVSVVDADTNQPIEGANIVAYWQLRDRYGPRDEGQLEIRETVTDETGRFHFDGFTKVNPTIYTLNEEDPGIVIFKAGYNYYIFTNQYPDAGTRTPGAHRKSQLDGLVVKLHKLEPYQMQNGFVNFYGGLTSRIQDVIYGGWPRRDCGWEKMPRFIVAMDREDKRIRAMSPKNYVDLITIDEIEGRRSSCGSAKAFFEEYTK